MPGLGVGQRIHGREPLEGVLAVIDPGGVEGLVRGPFAIRSPLAVRDPVTLRAPLRRLLHERGPAHESRVDGRPPHQHREVEPPVVQLLDAERHLPGSGHQQSREPDGVGAHLLGLLDDGVHRDLFAQVVDGVAVVGEDGVDQLLPDVVDVAEHRGQHDGPLRLPVHPLQVFFQADHRPLHHLGRLEHEGEDQLAGPEPVSHLFHGRQQHPVERLDGPRVAAAPLSDGLVHQRLDPVPLSVEDHPVDGLRGGHSRSGIDQHGLRRRVLLEEVDEPGQGVLAAIQDQIVGERALFLVDFRIGRDVERIHDGHVQACLHRVVEEHRVQHCPGVGLQAE